MPFAKAEPVSPYLKIAFYGAQGSGKTLTALIFAEALAKFRSKRIAMVDTEHGAKYYRDRIPQRTAHPEGFDFDVLETRSLAEVWKAVSDLDPKEYGVIIVDSITHLWAAAIEAYIERNGLGPDDKIPLNAWSAIKRPYKRLITFLSVESPFDTIIVGREKLLWKTNHEGKLEQSGVGMRAEGETPFEPDVLCRMRQIGKGGEQGSVALFGEKDRSGILAGRTITNPTAAAIEPFFAYLGTDAVKVDDEVARAEADGELLENERVVKKREKSKALLAEFTTRLAGASTMSELGAIQAELKKKTRSMIKEDVEHLRTYFEEIRSQLATKEAGSI